MSQSPAAIVALTAEGQSHLDRYQRELGKTPTDTLILQHMAEDAQETPDCGMDCLICELANLLLTHDGRHFTIGAVADLHDEAGPDTCPMGVVVPHLDFA